MHACCLLLLLFLGQMSGIHGYIDDLQLWPHEAWAQKLLLQALIQMMLGMRTCVVLPLCRVMVSCTSPSWVPTSPLMDQKTGLMYTAQTHHLCTIAEVGYLTPVADICVNPVAQQAPLTLHL